MKEIIQSWITAYNPTEEEKDIANNRLKICELCPAYKPSFQINDVKLFYICGDCGCPIPKKIFAKSKESCPKKIWPF